MHASVRATRTWRAARQTPPWKHHHARPPLRQSRRRPRPRRPRPPGQYLTEKFPVLHYGSVPKADLATWDFRVYGEVDNPFRLTWDEFRALPRTTLTTDIHCVTRWSKLDTHWEGVPIRTILEMAQVRPGAAHVVGHAEQGYTANLPLSVLDDDDVILADTFEGEPLEPEHGYPLRLLVPKRYFWKSAKWIRGLEFLTTTRWASGSATATTTTPTPGRRSASRAGEGGIPGLERRTDEQASSVQLTWKLASLGDGVCETAEGALIWINCS